MSTIGTTAGRAGAQAPVEAKAKLYFVTFDELRIFETFIQATSAEDAVAKVRRRTENSGSADPSFNWVEAAIGEFSFEAEEVLS